MGDTTTFDLEKLKELGGIIAELSVEKATLKDDDETSDIDEGSTGTTESDTADVNSKISELKQKITQFKGDISQDGGGNEIHEDIQSKLNIKNLKISDIEALQKTITNFKSTQSTIPKSMQANSINTKLNKDVKQLNVRLINDLITTNYAKGDNWRSQFIENIQNVLNALTSLKEEAEKLEVKIVPLRESSDAAIKSLSDYATKKDITLRPVKDNNK